MTITCDHCFGPCTCATFGAGKGEPVTVHVGQSRRPNALHRFIMRDIPTFLDEEGEEPPIKYVHGRMTIEAPANYNLPFRNTPKRRARARNDNTCE